MQNTDKAGELKKKKRKRTIDKAKVAENKQKAKAKKARMRDKRREERAQGKSERTERLQPKKVRREDITIIELGEEQDDDLLEAVFAEREIADVPDEETGAETEIEAVMALEEDAGNEASTDSAENVERVKKPEKAEKSEKDKKSEKAGKSEKGKKPEKAGKAPKSDGGKRKKAVIICAASIAVLAMLGTGITFGVRSHLAEAVAARAAVEAMVHTEAVELARFSKIQHQKKSVQKNAGKGTARALVDAARHMLDGVKNRPKPVEITEENALDFATIESCLINTETGKVDVTMSADGLAISDDGYYYLFEEKTYDTELVSEEYIIEEPKDVDLTFSVNLNYNSASSRLFSKFVVAIKKDGKFMAVSRPRYITNPEAVAKYRPSFGNTKSKKGLLVDPNKLRGTELDDLGVKHAAYNIPMSKILGETTMAVYPTVYYTYNGRTYAFNGQAISEYDFVFTTLSSKGITTTAIILNDMAPGHTQLIHPKARSGNKRSLYYAFNGTDDAGTEYMAAIGSFLANRYSGTGHGTVMNWVISNEINARSEWNYIEYMDTASYVEEFAKAFRVFYNAIVSVNGNARVYISLDQQWGKSLYSSNGYGSKEILDEFNRNIKACGNIDWGLAQHPYNYPLTSAKAWTLSSKAASYVTESENTPVLTIKNIHVLTNYLQKPEMLTDDGEVRHLILSEMGYTSTAGQELQSASFAYAYKIIEANRYIDSVLLSRQTDAAVEVQQGLALGINDPGGARKSLYTVYKYIDTPECAQYTDYLLPVIGISSWSEVIRQH